MIHQKERRIHVWDGPPIYLQALIAESDPLFAAANKLRPIYKGEIQGFSDLGIDSEISTIDGTAEITFNPSSEKFESVFLDFVLGDGRGNRLFFNNHYLRLNRIQTSDSDRTSFEDQDVDVGSFISIENYNYDEAIQKYKRKILFWGQVLDWGKSGKAQNIVLRCLSIGSVAGLEPAAHAFFPNDSSLPDAINVNDETDPNRRVVPSRYDQFSFIGETVGGSSTAVKVLFWLFHNSPYLAASLQLSDNPNEDFPHNDLTVPPPDLAGAFMFFDLNLQTISELIEEALEFLPSDWYFYLDYDPTFNYISPAQTPYTDLAYKPTFKLRKSKRKADGTSRLIPDYALTIDKEIIDYDMTFSGEEQHTHQITASKQQGRLEVVDLPNPGGNAKIRVQHVPEYQDVKDDEGNITGEAITESSEYIRRVVGLRPDPRQRFNVSEQLLNLFPRFRNKLDKQRILTNRRYNFREIDRIKPFPAGIFQGENPRQSLQNLINGYANDQYFKEANPAYAGRLTVVDTDERKIEDYRLGDVVAIVGSDDVMRYAIARISAISLGFHTAELTLSRVLINTERRLKALEIDNKNN